jgi:hypothetical protein
MRISSASGLRWLRAKLLTAKDNRLRVDADAEGLRAVGVPVSSGSGPGFGILIPSASGLRWRRAKLLMAKDSLVGVDADGEARRAAGMPLPSGSGPGRRRDFFGRSRVRRGGEERHRFRLGLGQGEEAFARIRRVQRFHIRGDFKEAEDELLRTGCGGLGRGRREGRGHGGRSPGTEARRVVARWG